ncbi:MAG: putative MPP superfamily phosphohydrolase [Myxococcota bacterium]|jgi:predicted MPP superfamily phosphohydrolase
MKLAWITDPHLNFVSAADADRLCESVIDSGASALLVSGDIAEAHDVSSWLVYLSVAVSMPVYAVLGNHDYYGGSIQQVRADVSATSAEDPGLTWLSESSAVWLTPTTALIGHGGWGDARLGEWLSSPVRLNDHRLIAELSGLPRTLLRQRLQALGDEAAAHLHRQLSQVTDAQQVIVLTHVPPFSGACWHEGATSGPDWLGDFTCQATGAVLARFALAHPNIQVRVFCGHSHSGGVYRRAENLTVTTGAAEYGAPVLQPLIGV